MAKTLCLDYTLLAVAPKCFLLPLQLSRSARTATHGQQHNKSVSLWQRALHLECEGLADKVVAFIRQPELPRDNMAPILSNAVPFQMSLSGIINKRQWQTVFTLELIPLKRWCKLLNPW